MLLLAEKFTRGEKDKMQDWREVQKLRLEIPPNGIVIISPLNSLHSPPSYRLIGDLCQGLGLFKLLLQMSFFPPRLCSRSSLGLLQLSLPQVWGQQLSCCCCFLVVKSCLCNEFHFSLFCSLEQRQQAAGCRVEGSSSL